MSTLSLPSNLGNLGSLEFLTAVWDGLAASPKTLPCRFFYDLEGSLLFEQICELPEYYLTRTEDAILAERVDEIAASLAPSTEVVELGCGSSRKTRRVLEALLRRQPALRYLPVDISGEMLAETARVLSREYPRLSVEPIVAEYGEALTRLDGLRAGPRIVLFLGSNLGNFTLPEAARFLCGIRATMESGDRLLLGLDLQKDRSTLEAAYDDPAGVTARFNLNLVARVNRELGGTFAPGRFRHRALYNEDEGRVEMHLVSVQAQRVSVAGREFAFAADETIHTENSYKYSPEQIDRLARMAALRRTRTWTDPAGLFSLNLFEPVDSSGAR